jgi:hypothetical protein
MHIFVNNLIVLASIYEGQNCSMEGAVEVRPDIECSSRSTRCIARFSFLQEI